MSSAKDLGGPVPVAFAPQLAACWRQDAEILRRRGAAAHAEVLESCAEELEARQREYQLEALSLCQAAEETGLSYSALQKMVANGRVANVGNKHRPRIRRGDLPRKAGRLASERGDGEPDLAGQVLAGRS